jgi:hypothetical protein
MQTFLPYADFQQSAQAIDRARLGKQRLEVLQLLNALTRHGGWSRHPAAKMWRGYENALVEYGLVICDEWLRRGYQDNCRSKIGSYFRGGPITYPPWLGQVEFHLSHRSNLVRKNPEFYVPKFGPLLSIPYVWPVK